MLGCWLELVSLRESVVVYSSLLATRNEYVCVSAIKKVFVV